MPVVCMIVYNDYYSDARVKRYTDALLDAGYEVDVFAVGAARQPQQGLRVTPVMSGKVLSQSALPTIAAQVAFLLMTMLRVGIRAPSRRYCAVHVHNMPDFLVFAALVPKLLGSRVILDIHDTTPEAYATKFNLPLEHPLIWLVKMEEVISAAFADHVITTQELHASTIKEHGVAQNKITIIMNLADTRIFHLSSNEHKHRGLTLVYHGTIAHRLGIDLILHAIKLARRDCADLRFILYGHGEYAPTVARIIAESDLGDIVEMSGSVPVTELPAILSRADLGVIGNRLVTEARHNWMLPVKMMEYAAMEIPTIAPRLRIIQHYFDDTNTLFYRPDDPDDLARCIRLAYENPNVLDQLRVGLRAFNTRYTWSEMAQRYLRLVQQPAIPDPVR